MGTVHFFRSPGGSLSLCSSESLRLVLLEVNRDRDKCSESRLLLTDEEEVRFVPGIEQGKRFAKSVTRMGERPGTCDPPAHGPASLPVRASSSHRVRVTVTSESGTGNCQPEWAGNALENNTGSPASPSHWQTCLLLLSSFQVHGTVTRARPSHWQISVASSRHGDVTVRVISGSLIGHGHWHVTSLSHGSRTWIGAADNLKDVQVSGTVCLVGSLAAASWLVSKSAH
jgi:hypothetical protein